MDRSPYTFVPAGQQQQASGQFSSTYSRGNQRENNTSAIHGQAHPADLMRASWNPNAQPFHPRNHNFRAEPPRKQETKTVSSCDICDRPFCKLVCKNDGCTFVAKKGQIKKKCAEHPRVTFTNAFACCPYCKQNTLEEQNLDTVEHLDKSHSNPTAVATKQVVVDSDKSHSNPTVVVTKQVVVDSDKSHSNPTAVATKQVVVDSGKSHSNPTAVVTKQVVEDVVDSDTRHSNPTAVVTKQVVEDVVDSDTTNLIASVDYETVISDDKLKALFKRYFPDTDLPPMLKVEDDELPPFPNDDSFEQEVEATMTSLQTISLNDNPDLNELPDTTSSNDTCVCESEMIFCILCSWCHTKTNQKSCLIHTSAEVHLEIEVSVCPNCQTYMGMKKAEDFV